MEYKFIPVSGDIFKCPHCGKETNAYAEIDPYSQCSGTIGITNSGGELDLDWDTADVDIHLLYKCAECDETVAWSICDLEDMVRAYEESAK